MPQSPTCISLQGNCLALLKSLPDHSVDACIADPPYNMSKKKGLGWAFSKHVTMQEAWDRFTDDDFFKFTAEWMGEVCRVVKPNGNLFFFGTYHNIYLQGFLLQSMKLKVLNSIIWVKPNAQPNITCRMLTESSEQLIWACNNPIKQATKWTFNYRRAKEMNGGKQMRNVWEFPLTKRSERVGHPSQKPLQLIERIVEIATEPGDWVLDPFAGSGTTGAAATGLGRNAIQMEKSPEYLALHRPRLGPEVNYRESLDDLLDILTPGHEVDAILPTG